MSDVFQDHYADRWSHCYGCGRLNEKGIRVRSRWDGEETVATVLPRPEHVAVPGFVYGGYLASVVDCHSTGSAAAAAHRAAGKALGEGELPRFLTASLRVEYLKPTPLGVPLELRSRIVEVKGRKVTVATDLSASGVVTVRGEAVLVQVPESWEPSAG
ncbi:PaaI family thioesterase [Acidobacteria bacterium ACD]|nr:MAG: PaaI family thioesterase [Acidobacteriota bacterium]MCE7959860.1 PaaI family thioesterase [Acidobacteria bacterium ACB2]MDL1949513.1 PaaI family thioesterase [Acidobacteria bacterium ACD]